MKEKSNMKRTCWNCEGGQYNLPTRGLICLNKKSPHAMQPVPMDGRCDCWKHDKTDPDLEAAHG